MVFRPVPAISAGFPKQITLRPSIFVKSVFGKEQTKALVLIIPYLRIGKFLHRYTFEGADRVRLGASKNDSRPFGAPAALENPQIALLVQLNACVVVRI